MHLKKTKISNCSITNISKVISESGAMSFVENKKNIPFDIKRVYYLYNVPIGKDRGGSTVHLNTALLTPGSPGPL